MYCSVKFFDPTVTWMPLLSGFSSIRLALVSPPSPSSSSSPPHAATPSARISATSNANSARTLGWLVIGRVLPSQWMQAILIRKPGSYLGGGCRPLQSHSLRGEQPLDAGQDELDNECEQRDENRAGEHAVLAVHVAAQDQVAERDHSRKRSDRRRGDDRDRRGAHA